MSVIQLLHGTDHIIEVPDIHIGNPHNDYGMGFYCTRVDEMAREWACKKNTDGFVNSYDFDTAGLKVLNLLDGTHTVLNWMALLLQFRTFKLDSEVAVDARDYLIDHYSIDLTGFDVVIGYRYHHSAISRRSFRRVGAIRVGCNTEFHLRTSIRIVLPRNEPLAVISGFHGPFSSSSHTQTPVSGCLHTPFLAPGSF